MSTFDLTKLHQIERHDATQSGRFLACVVGFRAPNVKYLLTKAFGVSTGLGFSFFLQEVDFNL